MTASADRPAAPDDPRLVRVVQDYLAALEAGQRPDRGEFVARVPELAAELGPYLDALDAVHSAAPLLAPAPEFSAEPLRRIRVFQSRTYLGCDTGKQEVERFRLVLGAEQKAAIQHEVLPVDSGEPLGLELAAFIHSVRTRTTPPVDGVAGRRALELAFRVREAIERARTA